jgi:hypothetical protein
MKEFGDCKAVRFYLPDHMGGDLGGGADNEAG